MWSWVGTLWAWIWARRRTLRPWRLEDLKVVAAKYTILKPVYIRQFVALIDKLEGAE